MMENKEQAINILIQDCDKSKISDGYHSFEDLYNHRNLLFVDLCKMLKKDGTLDIWRSIRTSDNYSDKDWFLMGINKDKGGQISYHLPMSMWDRTHFAETLDKAPEFDGHSSEDVLKRLKVLV